MGSAPEGARARAGLDFAGRQSAQSERNGGGSEGAQTRARSKNPFPQPRTSSDVIREALSLGALGYVNKSRAQTDLLPALDLLLAGKRFVSSGLRFSEGTEGQAPRGQETLFYSDDSVLTEGLTRFVGSALSAGKAAMVWAIESHRDRLLQRLRAGGVDIDGAIDRGLYM